MERKAQENLDAARMLVAGEEVCTNAAASRAYYAAYHACWVLMEDAGHQVPQTARGTYFPHKELPELARRAQVLTDEDSEALAFLESQRVVADYFREDLTLEVTVSCVERAERLVGLLSGEIA